MDCRSSQTSDAARAPLAGWARVADGIALVIAVLAMWQVLTDGANGGLLRYVVPDVSTAALLYALASVLLVRHVAHPSPTVVARLQQRWRRAGNSPAWGPALRAFAGTRLMVFVVGFFAVAAFGLAERPGFQISNNVLANLPARFDAGWYGGIAANGYEWNQTFARQSNIAFFPAMPLLMRAAGVALGARDRGMPREIRMTRTLWGGVAISLTAFLFALWYLVKVGMQTIGEDRAGGAALLLACYPFAFAFNAPYTESLFLLSSVAAVYHFHSRHWKRAGAWGLLAGLTRPNGFFLAVPLGLIALEGMWRARRADGERPWGSAAAAPLAVAAMPVAGMLMYTVYVFSVTRVWFAWARSHEAWGRSFEGVAPFETVWASLRDDGIVNVARALPFDTLNALALVFALVMVWPVYRKLGFAWAIYILISVVPPTLAGGVLSLGRLTSTLFPIFLALAATLPPRAVPHWAAAFALLQGLCASLFFTWRQLY
jgi:hypothetical protein